MKTPSVSYVCPFPGLQIDVGSLILTSQYVKQEQIETLADGTKKAVAIRQITERASSRIGRMAFELALKRAEERAANPNGSFWKASHT